MARTSDRVHVRIITNKMTVQDSLDYVQERVHSAYRLPICYVGNGLWHIWDRTRHIHRSSGHGALSFQGELQDMVEWAKKLDHSKIGPGMSCRDNCPHYTWDGY